jgi:hypothetical protein
MSDRNREKINDLEQNLLHVPSLFTIITVTLIQIAFALIFAKCLSKRFVVMLFMCACWCGGYYIVCIFFFINMALLLF